MGKMSLAPGFRFHPTDVELVKYYLTRKVLGKKLRVEAIAEVDIYKFAPWDLPDKSLLRTGDLKWYYFCPREKKYGSGNRLKRATEFGYWKTTGKDRPVHYEEKLTGMIKTLVFHQGKAPVGKRTDWVMHEYRLEDEYLVERNVAQDAYVLCVIFKKDGLGPRNGAQYGAPFREEDWSDEEPRNDDQTAVTSALVSMKRNNHINSLATSSHVHENQFAVSQPKSCVSNTPHFVLDVHPPIKDTGNASMPMEVPQVTSDCVLAMLDRFTDDEILASSGTGQNEEPCSISNANNVEKPLQLDGNDIYDGLMDLGDVGIVNEVDYNLADSYTLNRMEGSDNMAFIELLDLDAPLNSPFQGTLLEQTPMDDQLAERTTSFG